MTTNIMPETGEKLAVPAVSSGYPTPGANYKQGSYEIVHANSLVRAGKDYYDSKAQIPEGHRMSTAGEELAIQLALERAGEDPRKAEIFNDLFGRKNGGWYAWQWTETGLRVPNGRKADKYETDPQGRKYWVREVLEGDKVVGEILVPEGGGRLVAEWDKVFGVPRVTVENRNFPHNPYTTHFYFNATPDKDSISGHYDVAVGRGSDWHLVVDERCLSVDADFGRLGANSTAGFRLVRGSGPKIEKEFAVINPIEVEQAFLKTIRKDYKTLSPGEFRKKYKLY